MQDIDREIEIKERPLWLSVIDAFVAEVCARSLEFATSRLMNRHITIVNKHGQPVFSLVCYENRLTINSRFQLDLIKLIRTETFHTIATLATQLPKQLY